MAKTIKQQLDEIDQIIEWFNNVEEFELEAAGEKYRQAQQLIAEVREQLKQKQIQIEELK